MCAQWHVGEAGGQNDRHARLVGFDALGQLGAGEAWSVSTRSTEPSSSRMVSASCPELASMTWA
jgi:hypothetical protein